jgi:hypothetical protein
MTARPSGGADSKAEPPSARESNAARSAELDARHTRDYGSNTQYLVRPGLLADRSRRTVVIQAESIRLGAGTAAEFPLIAENSGKDYEALAVSFAKPSAVHEALVFIGIPPGLGIDPARLRFWPKGERVRIVFHYTEQVDGKETKRAVPAAQLITDSRTGKPLPEAGFVFTGSSWAPLPGSSATGLVYAADVFSPNSIVSVYNEPGTVLDVPRRLAQHEAYSYQIPNPDRILPAAQLIQVVMEAEGNNISPRVCDLTLKILPGSDAPPPAASSPKYLIQGASVPASTNATESEILEALKPIVTDHRDPFVTVQPDDHLTLASLRAAATLIDSLENEHEIRIEPPPPGHPYYRAFLPNEKHRQRSGRRSVQPWELFMGQKNGSVTGELVRVNEEWKGEDAAPIYHEQRFPMVSAVSLAGMIKTEDAPSVLLVFAPPDLSYGQLRQFISPVIEKGMILYVFLPPPPAPAPQAPAP